jgi:hypothetical protein
MRQLFGDVDFGPADPSGPHDARFDRLILEGHAGETGAPHVDVDRITEMVLQRGDSGRGGRSVPVQELGMARSTLRIKTNFSLLPTTFKFALQPSFVS